MMITRSRGKPAPRATSIDLSSDDSSSLIDEEMEVVEKNSRGKKRKTYDQKDTKVDGQPQTKKVRGKRGLLKQLVEMPVDVLFEIFGRLEPLDLIHLTRTSKDLRALLLTRSSISTWKQSLANIPGLPVCPDDLTEPQYAELVFGKCCHICNKNSGIIQTMWGSRVRACIKCFETNNRFKEARPHYTYRIYGPELYKLVPAVVARRSGRNNRVKYFTDSMLDNSWSSEYSKLESSSSKQQEWLVNKIQEMTVVETHAMACLAWVADVHSRREADKQTVIDNRKALVVKRLRDLGWGGELDRLDEYAERPENHSIVVKACQKDLTKKVMSSLEAPLIQFMEAIKSRRVQEERRKLLEERLAVLSTVLETCVSTLPVNAIYPTTADLFRIPFVRNIVDAVSATGNFTNGDLESVSLSFDILNLQWQKEMERKLLDLILAAEGSDVQDSLDADTVFNLATSFFSCRGCSRFLRYPAILMHRCATKYCRVLEKDDIDHFHIAEILGRTFWNTNLSISMKPEHVRIVSRLLDMVGLDPKTATVQGMDALDPIFECIPCNSLTEGRAIMSWQTALVHHDQKHNGPNFGLVVLDEIETEAFRPRMTEQVERERHQDYIHDHCMICVLCKRTGQRMSLRKHIRKDHGKPNPAEEDVVLKVDADPIPNVYRHWPPREE